MGKVKPGLMENATGGGITYAGGGNPKIERKKKEEEVSTD